jgi:hypothetical protein
MAGGPTIAACGMAASVLRRIIFTRTAMPTAMPMAAVSARLPIVL